MKLKNSLDLSPRNYTSTEDGVIEDFLTKFLLALLQAWYVNYKTDTK